MPIAALPSAHTRNPVSTPRSRAADTSPAPSAAPWTIPASSASPELRAMGFLCRGPALDHAPAPQGRFATRSAPSGHATNEVGIGVD
eukprot:11987495-Alexandrium_andersonii.AAC.1